MMSLLDNFGLMPPRILIHQSRKQRKSRKDEEGWALVVSWRQNSAICGFRNNIKSEQKVAGQHNIVRIEGGNRQLHPISSYEVAVSTTGDHPNISTIETRKQQHSHIALTPPIHLQRCIPFVTQLLGPQQPPPWCGSLLLVPWWPATRIGIFPPWRQLGRHRKSLSVSARNRMWILYETLLAN